MPNYSNTVNTNIAGMQLYDPSINNHSNTWPSSYHQNYIPQQQAMQYPRYPFMPSNYFNPVSNHPMYQVVMVPHLVPVVPVPQSTPQIHAPLVQAPPSAQSQPLANSSIANQQNDHIIPPSSSNANGASGFGGSASSTNPNAIIEQMLMHDSNYQDEIIRVCMMQERANQDKLVQERLSRERTNGSNGPRLLEEDRNEVKTEVGMFPFGNNADYQQHYNIYNPESLHFLKFLDKGCEIAEKVSIRNQHRACFKNVHNLCYRTRNEINQPYPTISNIHSQGIPFATKDFIYAFVRMINCWHLMKGYIQLKDGLLGHIHSELSDEFRTCFRKWEVHTIEISKHLVRIITNLDGNIRNPAPLPVFQALRQGISVCNNEQTRESPDSSDDSSSSQSNSELSTPHGKYNHENFTPGIEFLPVAANVDQYLQKMAGESKFTEEDEWVNALAACNFYSHDGGFATFSRKESKSLLREIYPFDDPSDVLLNDATDATEATVQEIQNTEADDSQPEEEGASAMENSDESSATPPLDEETKKSTTPRTIGPPSGRRIKAREELEMDVMRKLLEEIKHTDLYKTLHSHSPQKIFHCRDNLHAIISNYYYKYYASTKIMFYDIDRVIAKVQKYFINDSAITKQVEDFTSAMTAFKKIHCQDVTFEENGRNVDDADARI